MIPRRPRALRIERGRYSAHQYEKRKRIRSAKDLADPSINYI